MDREQALTLRLTLLDTQVWREIRVAEQFTLARLHKVIQIVMGWKDAHLHEFQALEEKVRETLEVGDVLTRTGHKMLYVYDFGDCWEIEIERKSQRDQDDEALPFCLNGSLAGPPEDCGGIPGYEELVQVKSKKHPEEDDLELLEWAGDWDPTAFDLDKINLELSKRFKLKKPKVAKAPDSPSQFTHAQGQYLSFIFWYTRIMRQPPAHTDIQRFFGVSSAAVASMIATLERSGLLKRGSGQARSLKVLLDPSQLPFLDEPNTPHIPTGRTWMLR